MAAEKGTKILTKAKNIFFSLIREKGPKLDPEIVVSEIW